MGRFSALSAGTLLAMGMAACGDRGGGGGDDGDSLEMSGTVVEHGGALPGGATVGVIWAVEDAPAMVMAGGGTVSADGYQVSVSEPPSNAVRTVELEDGTTFEFSLGFPVVFAPGEAPPNGPITEDVPDAAILGGSVNPFVWRGSDVTVDWWLDEFPVGLSCGRCVRAPEPVDPEDFAFDSFEPAPCDELPLDVGAEVEGCNWT